MFDARVVCVTDGGCRYESQNAVGISGVVCRRDIGVWMRWGRNGLDAATGDQRGGVAKFGERPRGKFTGIHGDGDGNDEHRGDMASQQRHRRKFHDRNDRWFGKLFCSRRCANSKFGFC
jgi:hypothetical protein